MFKNKYKYYLEKNLKRIKKLNDEANESIDNKTYLLDSLKNTISIKDKKAIEKDISELQHDQNHYSGGVLALNCIIHDVKYHILDA